MKSKRSEGKSLLSGMYTAQKSFYAEWTQYYGDFNAVGFGLDGDLTYGVGFSAAGVAGPTRHPFAPYQAAPTVFQAAQYCTATGTCFSKIANIPLATLVANLPPAVPAVATFVFGASTDLDNDGIYDQWTIDDTRTFTLVSDDIQ